jgi:hypothetical protein
MLPMASAYGKTIRNKDKEVECRNRVFKAMKERLPAFILQDLSSPGTSTSNSNGQSAVSDTGNPLDLEEEEKAVESDNGFILDVLKAGLQLMPSKRLTPSVTLNMPVFTIAACMSDQQRTDSLKTLVESIFHAKSIKKSKSSSRKH